VAPRSLVGRQQSAVSAAMTGVTSTPPDGISRERLSSQGTLFYRSIAPVFVCVIAVAGLGIMGLGAWGARDPNGLAIIAFVPLYGVVVYMTWRGRSLHDVWLVGDGLDVSGRKGTVRIPLRAVHMIDGGGRWTSPRMVVLWLDRAVGDVREVRFMPRGAGWFGVPDFNSSGVDAADELVAHLRSRVAQAREAQTPA
jgi:hypothetical protein